MKPYPKFTVIYRVGDATFTAVIQAKDRDEAKAHVDALILTGMLDGQLMEDA